MKITIDKHILDVTPNFSVSAMTCHVEVFHKDDLSKHITQLEHDINNQYDISDVIHIPEILDGRNAYKTYGKDPSRYRLAVESLYRRLSKGNKLYQINNVVDSGNVLSIRLKKSVAVLDADQIQGDVTIRLGTSNDEYYGIGRGKLNIENIPLYEDDISPFGSVTSDTERTMITKNTKRILVLVINFSSDSSKDYDTAKSIFKQFCNATEIKKIDVSRV